MSSLMVNQNINSELKPKWRNGGGKYIFGEVAGEMAKLRFTSSFVLYSAICAVTYQLDFGWPFLPGLAILSLLRHFAICNECISERL